LFFLASVGWAAGSLSDHDGVLAPLGGPNGFLYDLTLRLSQPQRAKVPTVPALFVAIDEETLARPEFVALPRALFQPIWARLTEGLLTNGARQVAFDAVFAFAGSDFQLGDFTLPDYDRPLLDVLTKGRDRIVLGRFPALAPAAAFVRAVGPSRIGVLDVQLESDGRIRSTGALVRLADGRIGLSFATLAAGWSISRAASAQRLLVAPSSPPDQTPTYRLGVLLDCLSSTDAADAVRKAVEGRIVVVGTAIPGEDEHRGPARFLDDAAQAQSDATCAPTRGLANRAGREILPGALFQIAAIQSAASARSIVLAPRWLRSIAGALLVAAFGFIALRDESALTIGERAIAPRAGIVLQTMRSIVIGLTGPFLLGCLICTLCMIYADHWLPLGYPIAATSVGFGAILSFRWSRHRLLFGRLYRTAGRYLPPARLATLARSGFTDTPDGQERDVSILLADLVGFTAFSDGPNRRASEVVGVANRYFSLMQAAIDRYGGCSDKFLGDAVLAFWNGIVDEPDHALKALAAASDIVRTVAHDAETGMMSLAVRVVVCSGRVYVGDVGAALRSNFTIIGNAVNEIFRIEKLSDHYGVPLLVAGSTVDLIKNSSAKDAVAQVLSGRVLVRLDDIELKGFAEPRSIYALVPADDPGLMTFEAARRALDQNGLTEAVARLKSVDNGMLVHAAKVLHDRFTSTARTAPTHLTPSSIGHHLAKP
jgi:class 3 adenylate cyclase